MLYEVMTYMVEACLGLGELSRGSFGMPINF